MRKAKAAKYRYTQLVQTHLTPRQARDLRRAVMRAGVTTSAWVRAAIQAMGLKFR